MSNIAIVGATGIVGREILRILEERSFPVDSLYLLASSNSNGKVLLFNKKEHQVEDFKKFQWDTGKVDIAFFCAGSEVSKQNAEKIAKSGCIIIDKSSYFRMDKEVPLVVPEVNPDAILDYRHKGIVASPNCTTIPLVMVLNPLHDLFKIKRVVVSTYQSVSGMGSAAMNELYSSSKKYFEVDIKETDGYEDDGETINSDSAFPVEIAFNCIPHCDDFTENGYTKEEMKIINETNKILGTNIDITATSVRVPVFIGHSESVNIEFENAFDIEKVRDILDESEGIMVVDNQKSGGYMTQIKTIKTDEVFVSRIRRDESIKNGLNLWICCNNLRKGAALNAVQIAEKLI